MIKYVLYQNKRTYKRSNVISSQTQFHYLEVIRFIEKIKNIVYVVLFQYSVNEYYNYIDI